MTRFIRNRLWISLLALVLCMGTMTVLTHASYANDSTSLSGDAGGGSSSGSGDPDAPGGNSAKRTYRGALVVPVSQATVGDGSGAQSVWMGNLGAALQIWWVTFLHQ
jgi:hypothetical protein